MRFLFVFLVGCSMIGSSAFAQVSNKTIKMGHFDGKAVLDTLLKDNADYQKVDELKKAKALQSDLLEAELKMMKANLEKEGAEMDEVMYKLRVEELEATEKIVQEYEEVMQSEIDMTLIRAVQPQKARLTLAVRQSAEENDVNYIVDTSDNTVLYDLTGGGDDGKEGVQITDDSIDLQQAILKKL